MRKWLKTIFFSLFLFAATFFFGMACGRIQESCAFVLQFSLDFIKPFLLALVAMGVVAVAAGLVAALIRPVGLAGLIFFLSGLTMFLGWRGPVERALPVLVYVVAAPFFTSNVARELDERVHFSVTAIGRSQGLLLASLAIVACGSLFFSCHTYIEREGFTIPEAYLDIFMGPMGDQIQSSNPEGMGGQSAEEFEQQSRQMLEQMVRPFEKFVPLVIALGILFPLISISNILGFVPVSVLEFVFYLLGVLKVTKVIIEGREVERLVID
jgi:hypothetical protein